MPQQSHPLLFVCASLIAAFDLSTLVDQLPPTSSRTRNELVVSSRVDQVFDQVKDFAPLGMNLNVYIRCMSAPNDQGEEFRLSSE